MAQLTTDPVATILHPAPLSEEAVAQLVALPIRGRPGVRMAHIGGRCCS